MIGSAVIVMGSAALSNQEWGALYPWTATYLSLIHIFKASGLDGDYRILADFGGTVLAGPPSKHGVQFVTWKDVYKRQELVRAEYLDQYRITQIKEKYGTLCWYDFGLSLIHI